MFNFLSDILPVHSKALPSDSLGVIVLDKDLMYNGASSDPVFVEKLAMVISNQICNQVCDYFYG